MVRISKYILGYRNITSDVDAAALASRLLRQGIPSEITSDGRITVLERDLNASLTLLGDGVKVSEPLGLVGVYKRTRYKVATALSLLVSLVLVTFLSGLVWDVRIDGNERLTDFSVEESLAECGFSVGKSWRRIDTSSVESRLLSEHPEISWVNINRRGTVAYVTVAESELPPNAEQVRRGYANVVASCDCIIEEITVHRGIAEVKRGDAVKRGDVLISGIIPDASGGGFTYADGTVVGRVEEKISVHVPREYEQRVKKSEKCVSLAVKLFDFRLNIFKNYRNFGREYVIIKEIGSYSLFGGARLPLETLTEHAVIYDTVTASYTDRELVSVAAARLDALVISRLSSATLYKLRTDGGFTDTGYEMYSIAVFAEEVGTPLEFSAQ